MTLMENFKKSSIVAKLALGAGSLAIVGLIGFGAAQAATGDNTGSGYGNGSQQVAAADTFADAVNTDNDAFASQVASLSAQAQNTLKSGTTVSDFDTRFVAASDAYTNSLNDAFNTFVDQANAAANTAQNKDQFIDKFNHAKADYLNALDAAKNQFANALSPLGDNANQAKDTFINGYNSDRDSYSNKLEQAKNNFAATVSNIQ